MCSLTHSKVHELCASTASSTSRCHVPGAPPPSHCLLSCLLGVGCSPSFARIIYTSEAEDLPCWPALGRVPWPTERPRASLRLLPARAGRRHWQQPISCTWQAIKAWHASEDGRAPHRPRHRRSTCHPSARAGPSLEPPARARQPALAKQGREQVSAGPLGVCADDRAPHVRTAFVGRGGQQRRR